MSYNLYEYGKHNEINKMKIRLLEWEFGQIRIPVVAYGPHYYSLKDCAEVIESHKPIIPEYLSVM